MAPERDPALAEVVREHRRRNRRHIESALLTRLIALPALGGGLAMIWARLMWAAFAIPGLCLVTLVLHTVLGFARDKQLWDETMGAYRRAKRGKPPVVWRSAVPDVQVASRWGGLPPARRGVSVALGVAAGLCLVLAVVFVVVLAVGSRVIEPRVVIPVELVLLVLLLVAVTAWQLRCERAVWVYRSSWLRASAGSLRGGRWLVLLGGLMLGVALVVWAGVTLNTVPVPWLEGACEPTVCSAGVFAQAVQVDAVGNLAMMGMGFLIAFLNSLGGHSRDGDQPQLDTDATQWKWQGGGTSAL